MSTSGYLRVSAKGHPVADQEGWAYAHRVVLYDKIGGGEQACHWCKIVLVWFDDLETDHVDFDRLNNDPENLVPACRSCNTGRSLARRWADKATHCNAGHEYSAENTYVTPTGIRSCRTCNARTKRRWKERNRRPCRACGKLREQVGAVQGLCDACIADPTRNVKDDLPATCSKGHELSGDNLTFVRASGKSNRLRWRCVECTRRRSYEAFQRRRAAA